MMVVSATEAKTNFGKYFSTAMSESVIIRKTDHEMIIMISRKEYDRLEGCEDAYWGIRASSAEKSGYLGKEEGPKIIAKTLNA
ncbi:MAG: hypothetical protein B7Y25_03455 [Alphaproteobacteria bacterium 16-39-46]|nr:MAG: hypothetical protein B7Y25_03455 [Alphaproteobacteria bacterium 16-39-46]OZA43324.1 MAG: hypothetical protein B7X84_03505 [Alphaproteobacteria bacterium 17-39-52]HQS83928.1 type II toxin-antitoxin system Phd/YefM family antitoxin [Alphaproteobacteria bacterium]HQS93786.1 type II toxin-antitoxin system Phd/YefM family antitoxin [Alphaproteobacteria bacterium]